MPGYVDQTTSFRRVFGDLLRVEPSQPRHANRRAPK
jgi:hypothetical protein